jgi:hypothetical protein
MKLVGMPPRPAAARLSPALRGTDDVRLMRPHPCRLEGGGSIGSPFDPYPSIAVAPFTSTAFNSAAEGIIASLAFFTPVG